MMFIVSVWILQRSITSRPYIEKDFYKELGHVIIKANKSQDLQSELTNWRADGVVPVLRPEDLRLGKN